MIEWRVLIRTNELVTLACDDAMLVIETSRVDVVDPELRAAIGRLAPHLAFGECTMHEGVIERAATCDGQRVVVGRFARGATSVAYMVASRGPVDVDDVIAAYLPELPSPFDHFAD
jgi:hypothetical protein